jgi:hypothetical protein
MIIAGIVAVVVVVIAGILVLVMKSKGKTSSPSKRGGQGQNENACTKKLAYLLKIVVEHDAEPKGKSSKKEIVRLGEEVHQTGGFRSMVRIHHAVTEQTSPKFARRLSTIWKGVGDWRGS